MTKKITNKELPGFTKGEEIFNAVTHIVGGGLGIISLIVNIVLGVKFNHTGIEIFSFIIYSVCMIILYAMSSIYHFLRPVKAKKVFRVFDHCTIYLLIAGTYTPICVNVFAGTVWGAIILWTVWLGAIAGIIINAINMHAKWAKVISMILYVITGWSIIVFVGKVLEVWELGGFIWLLAGGLAYTIGIIFFMTGKKARYIHSVWHLFVLLGTILQYIGILVYIIMR